MSPTKLLCRWALPALFCGSALNLSAQTGTSVLASGAVCSQNDQIRICATIGQAAIGAPTGTALRANIGFWLPVRTQTSTAVAGLPLPDPGIVCTPNPVVHSATVAVTGTGSEAVSLELLDIFGREVRTLLDQHVIDGQLSLQLDTDQIPSGRYTLVLSDGKDHSSLPILISH